MDKHFDQGVQASILWYNVYRMIEKTYDNKDHQAFEHLMVEPQ